MRHERINRLTGEEKKLNTIIDKELSNKTVMVTGATGLIGQTLIKRLIKIGSDVIAVVRKIEKAERLFGPDEHIRYVVSDVTELEINPFDIDYIIHGASNTSSKAFVEDPIGIINTAIEGTKRTLEIARLSKVKGYVYLSSMEVYGAPETDEKIDENFPTNLNTMKVRSAYPESKRMCENLCASYVRQYNVPAKVIRLTQTFGPGVQYGDGRVFAEFARCAIEGRNIILHTKGETKRNYLYTEDAVDAILTVLVKGEYGEAYNAANEDTYCSIYEMAEMVCRECANNKIEVKIEETDYIKLGYAPTLYMNLDTNKIQALGWKAKTNLKKMFINTVEDMKKYR